MQEINFPDEVATMLFVLLGTKPLQARENLAYDSRELYLEYGRGLRDLREAVRQSVSDASTNLPPEVSRRYIEGLSLLTDDGGVDHIQRMIDQLDDLAMGQVDHSMNIQASKWEIIAEITMLLIELALMAALAAFTGGTSFSQMALARARSRLAVLMIIDRLIRLARFGPTLGGALEEAIQALAVRLAQIAVNPPGRRPDGIDWGDIGKAAAFGAVAGAFEGILEGAGNHIRNWFKGSFDKFDSFDDFARNNPHTSNVLNHGLELPGVFVVAAVSEGAAETLVNWAFEGTLEWNWDTFVGAGSAGVAAVAAMGLAGGAGLWLHNKFSQPDRFTDYNQLPPPDGGFEKSPSGNGSGATTVNGTGNTSGVSSVVSSAASLYGTAASGPVPVVTTGATASYGVDPGHTSPAGTPPASPRIGPADSSSPHDATGPAYGSPGRFDPSVNGLGSGGFTPPANLSAPPAVTTPATGTGVGSGAGAGAGAPQAGSGTRSAEDREFPAEPGPIPEPETDGTTDQQAAAGSTPAAASPLPSPATTSPGTTSPASVSPAPAAPSGPGTGRPSTASADPGPAEERVREAAAEETQRPLPDNSAPDTQPAPESGTTGIPGVGHGAAWEAARAATPPVTRSHTWVDPVSTPPDPTRPGETTQYAVRSKFDARRFQYDGEWITDLTVRIGSLDPAGLPQAVREKVLTGVAELLNDPAYRLPNGDRLHVTVETVAHDPHPNGLNVAIVGPGQQMTRSQWWAHADAVDYVHEIMHQLGLRDESGHPNAPQRPDIAGSLLGDYTLPAPYGLARKGLRGRHLQLLAAHIGDLGSADVTAASTAPGTTVPPRPVATTGGRPGAEPYAPKKPQQPAASEASEASAGLLPEHGTPAVLPTPPVLPTMLMSGPVGSAPQPSFVPALPVPATDTAEAKPVPEPAAAPKSAEPEPGPKPTPKPKPAAREWISATLDRNHPPKLDRTMTAPADNPGPATPFKDGRRIPAHIDELRSLLEEVPDGVAAEALVSFGHADLTLRGADQAIEEISRILRENPAIAPGTASSAGPHGVGPGSAATRALSRAYRKIRGQGSPEPGNPGDSLLIADISHALKHEPRSLTGEGRGFPYTDSLGRPRSLHIVARHYRGEWRPFADGYGDPTKIDGMQRSAVTAGQSKSMQSSLPLAFAAPIGPAGSTAFSGFGRVALRAVFARKTGYGQTDQGTSQTETRTLDGSRVYLTHTYFHITVVDADNETVVLTPPAPETTGTSSTTGTGTGTTGTNTGTTGTGTGTGTTSGLTASGNAPVPPTAPGGNRPAPDPIPAVFGFGMRNGLSLRLPDSATAPRLPLSARIPRSMVLDSTSTYRLVRPEDFGPVAHILAWAAAELGVGPGSGAHRELSAFFSSGSFHRHSRTLANGRIISPPLFADDKSRTPLGAFVVDVVPTRAIHVSDTADAEIRDTSISSVRNDRSLAHITTLGLDLSAGPAFNFSDVLGAGFNLRFQFGPAGRYLVSWARSRGLGGSGAFKTAGQVKGDKTALYLVKKDVFVSRTGGGTNPRRFQTWSLDRMTHTEARRLAGWDDGTALALGNGVPEPFAPACLTVDNPRTLGMHRVEEFTFTDGQLRHGGVPGTNPGSTLLDDFADAVVSAAAQEYPGLVAPLSELTPPPRRREQLAALFRGERLPSVPGRPRWRSHAQYEAAVFNTRQILAMISDAYMRANLEALTTTGFLIPLFQPGVFGQAHRYIRVRGTLTGRRFRGVQGDFKHRFSSVGAERVDGQTGAKRGGELGLEAALSFRDPSSDDIGATNNAGTLSAGVREGWQTENELSFGSTVSHEPTAVSTGPAHLYEYSLSLTADHGGYWRFRGLLRGTATLGLLGTQPFLFSSPQDVLVGTAGAGHPVGGGPKTGRVLISVPGRHAPATDPHADGALNPYAPGAAAATATPMRPERALALAKGDLSGRAGGTGPGSLVRPGDPDAGDGAALTGPAPDPGDPGQELFRRLQSHPFVTVNVMAAPELVASADEIIQLASGGSWQLTQEGAPTRSAILRAFQPQLLTSNFDQSSGPLGWSAAGLMGKGPYGTLWATFRHVTTVTDIRALTPSVPMDSEMITGGTNQSAGKVSRSTSVFTGGQLTYARAHSAGSGLLGTYGLIASPFSKSASESLTVTRVAIADMNRKSVGHQVLVAGTAEHWLALASSWLGPGAVGKSLVPRQLASAAGQMTSVPGGWQAHVPEKSAHELGLVEDGLGDVPRYTGQSWSPQPWLVGNEFGTYAVNSLDATRALEAFDRAVATLGLGDEDRERIRSLVTSRVTRSLGKEMTGTGSSAPVRTGGWGWHSVRLGGADARVRFRLVPGRTTVHMLDHGVEMEESRHAVETVTRSRDTTKGAALGQAVSEAVHTGMPGGEGPVAAGPSLTETGSGRRSAGSSRSTTVITIFRAASTEPYAATDTTYDLQITLEIDNVPAEGPTAPASGTDRGVRGRVSEWRRQFAGKRAVSVTEPAGTLRENVPLSLMMPGDPDDGLQLPPLPAPREITATDQRPVTRLANGRAGTFTFPEHGFDVRRVAGRAGIRTANHYAIALSYSAAFSPDADDAALRAGYNGLTRAGTGSAQTLEDGTSNAMLTAWFHRAVTDDGYRLTDLVEKNLIGTESARLRLSAMPDFSGALLLTVADGEKMEVLRLAGEGVGSSESRENAHDMSPGAALVIASPETGVNQYAFTGPGPNETSGGAIPAGAEHLASINVKPKTGRVFVFAIPTAWVSDADVERGIRDWGLLRRIGGTFGQVRPGPKSVRSDTHVLVRVREDVARELGLISDANFPASASKAWDAVGSAGKEWVSADTAYWKKRRPGAALYAEMRAAHGALEAAAEAARDPRRAFEQARDVLRAEETALEQTLKDEARDVETAQRNADAAHDALETVTAAWESLTPETEKWRRTALARVTSAEEDARSAQTAADALIAAARLRTERARERVTEAEKEQVEPERNWEAARRLLDRADARFDTARTAWETLRNELAELRSRAETAAAEFHRVRAATDRLTRWHQRAATQEGRERLEAEGIGEPPPVVFRALPKAPAKPKAPAPPAYTRISGDGRSLLVSPGPEPVTHVLHDVPRDGDAFLRALVQGLARTAPGLLADKGLDLADPPATLARLRRMLADVLTDPGDPDLLDLVAPDVTDVFTDEEITDAGLTADGTGPLAPGTPQRREFDGLGGLMPHSAALSREARAALAVSQILRPGEYAARSTWD
ncbi:hypothetical protein GUY61_08970, partial [Streptomyces sp. GC420]|nr:hypothetical protein [Streptomyces sp. GC420]